MRVRGGSGAAAGPVPPPAGLRPMQPTAVRELPADQASWAFEPKWDGYRALGHVVGGGLALRSRNGVDMAGWFPELGGLAGAVGGRGAVLDGEVVAFDDRGRPSFEALQQGMAGRAGRRRGAPVTYLVFDLLWLEGRLLTGCPTASVAACSRTWPWPATPGRRWGRSPGPARPCWPPPPSRAWRGWWPSGWPAPTSRAAAPATGSRSSTTSARPSWSAGSCPTPAARSAR